MPPAGQPDRRRRPTRLLCRRGIRIDPHVRCRAGWSKAAATAAGPPLDPPDGVAVVRVAGRPPSELIVVMFMANSCRLVFAMMIAPAPAAADLCGSRCAARSRNARSRWWSQVVGVHVVLEPQRDAVQRAPTRPSRRSSRAAPPPAGRGSTVMTAVDAWLVGVGSRGVDAAQVLGRKRQPAHRRHPAPRRAAPAGRPRRARHVDRCGAADAGR